MTEEIKTEEIRTYKVHPIESSFQRLFRTPDGKAAFKHLAKKVGWNYNNNVTTTKDALTLAFHEGKRSLFNDIMSLAFPELATLEILDIIGGPACEEKQDIDYKTKILEAMKERKLHLEQIKAQKLLIIQIVVILLITVIALLAKLVQ
jgi:hypothetical protein